MTMPSGSDPSQMTPGALDGSLVGGGFSALVGRTQAAVTADKKTQVAGNNIITTVFGAVYEGLESALGLAQAVIGGITQAITGLVGGIPILGPFITGKWVAIDTAQASADNANVGVAQLEGKLAQGNVPGGVLIDDTFARTATNPGPNYTVSLFGVGPWTPQTDGNNLFWTSIGGADGGALVRHNTPLATNTQSVAFVTAAAFPVITNPTYLSLFGRCDAAMTNRVEATITNNACYIAIVVGGVATTIGSGSVSTASGDRWTLKLGTTNDVREFVLYQNGTEVLRATDTSGTSLIGSSNRFVGLTMFAGTQYLPPFTFVQVGPPGLQSFTANDRLAAA
ncbi:hypothetical protein [Mycobacterium sp. AZCC_0083]|uniref:DUF7257 domain-containing protein n=1 Tax=Mycobacterium sp. AZCC_0083 TaxID=2735882 RepID=UPI0016149AAF|nr:hypothetical protein [Mycobacterium sp. AZCC_0083]MBB5167198.1 hypothetical protein [Mycobacterium sp. AZCC_0083]